MLVDGHGSKRSCMNASCVVPNTYNNNKKMLLMMMMMMMMANRTRYYCSNTCLSTRWGVVPMKLT
jgi:hypothetical protein